MMIIRSISVGALFVVMLFGMRGADQTYQHTYKINSIHLADNLPEGCRPDISTKDLTRLINTEFGKLGYELNTKQPALTVDISLILGNEKIRSYWQLNNHQFRSKDCTDKIYELEIIINDATTGRIISDERLIKLLIFDNIQPDLQKSIESILTLLVTSYEDELLYN